MIKYRFTLNHGKKEIQVTTFASSIASAVVQIMVVEKCPECAIIKIEVLG